MIKVSIIGNNEEGSILTTSRPVIALFGLFGLGNLGNDSTLQAILYQLKRRQPEADVVCITPATEIVAAQFNVRTIALGPDYGSKLTGKGRLMRLIQRLWTDITQVGVTLRHLRSIDRLIIPGTGALDDFGLSPLWIPYLLMHWCLLARVMRVPVEFVSVGAGPIHHPLSRFFMLQALRLASYRSYRDEKSKEYLKQVGFNSTADAIYPDLAFSLPLGEDATDSLPSSLSPNSPPKTFGIGVMGYYGWNQDPVEGEQIYQTYVAKLIEFVTWVLDQGYGVRLLMGEIPIDQRPVDDVLAAVAAHPAAQAGAITVKPILKVEDVFRAIADTDMVIATRFHNVVFGLMLARPIISLGYAAKNEVLLNEMGQVGYSQHIESFSVDTLKEQVLRLVANHAEASEKIAETNRHYRQLLDDQYDSLFTNTVYRAASMPTYAQQSE